MTIIKYGIALAAIALGGCSSDDAGTSEPAGKSTTPAAATGAKDVFGGSGYKADCLDCAEDGPNAFVQLGLGDRFWKVGDAWQVAYQLKTDIRVQRAPLPFQEKLGEPSDAKQDVGLALLDFAVVAIGSRSTGGVERATATIRITQGEGRGAIGQIVGEDEIRVDETTRSIDLEIDDLLRPVSVTEYSGPRGRYPNGKTVQLDPRESLRNIGSAFPYVVPNAYLGAEKTALPPLPEVLSEMASATRQGAADRQYFHFDLANFGADSAEQVYWAAGDLWPFYVDTPTASGVLVFQNN